jgi:hypothetical protein
MSTPRLFSALALLCLVLTHALALTAIRARFEWQRAEIEQTLCENRNRPELGCHGSCVLRKQLKAAEDATHGLLRLRADALPDFVLPAAATVPVAPLVFVATTVEWAATPPISAYDAFLGGSFRPPAPQIS